MSKNLQIIVCLLVAVAFVIISTGTNRTDAQQSTSGEWTASVKESSNKIQLNFEQRTPKGKRNQHGHSFEFADLQGLTREQTAGGPVRFSLVREAGRIDCEGSFQNGKGLGTFQFTPNAGFISAMKSRGFDFEKTSKWNDDDENDHSDNKLLAATTLNVTTALADDLVASGFGKLDVDDLFKATIFKIDSKFMREMKASGFPNLTMEDLVKARIFKIDAEFVTKATQMGFDKEPFESLVKMSIFKITPEYVAEIRNEGLTDLQMEDVVKLRIFKIDAAYIREVKADGGSVDVERLVQRKIGVGKIKVSH
jgi:hypothetical protein